MLRDLYVALRDAVHAGLRAAVSYVVDTQDPLASDANAGDADHPWKTIGRGLRALRPGDTLRIRAGIYRENLGEVRLAGTAAAPILIQAEPGVVLRPTVLPAAPPVKVSDTLWRVDAPESARVVETDEAAWTPIFVNDPNGVNFYLTRPVPSHPVETMEALQDVPGSSWYDTMTKSVFFRPYGSAEAGVELLPATKISWRVTHTTLAGLEIQHAGSCQLYQARSMTLDGVRLLGTPLLLNAAHDTTISRMLVEQVIKRGRQFEWFTDGTGSALSIMANCQRTSLTDLVARHSWNGPVFGGQATTVDGAVLYGFPNHGLGVSGIGTTLQHVKAYRAQEGAFIQDGDGVTITDSEIERAIVVGGGHTLDGKPMLNLTLKRNTIHLGHLNASDDSTIAASDENYWITTQWDYRYQNQRATTFENVRAFYGLELRSTWDNRLLPR